MVTGRLAYGNARVRSLKSQLFDVGALRRVVNGDNPDVVQQRWHQLIRCYTVVLRSYPTGQSVFRALLTLHEIENLKLLWRARTRLIQFDRWQPLWQPLGPLETLRIGDCRDLTSLVSLVAVLQPTPYGRIAEAVLRSHSDDLAACELAFDRWASNALASAARALSATETAARDLALAVVRERDLNLLRRGVPAFGLSTDAVVGSLVLLPAEIPGAELARLATWRPEEGRLIRAWPKAWRNRDDPPADWDGLFLASRRMRRRACQRAFLGTPFCLAPAVALVLYQEEEVRGLTAVLESGRGIDMTETLNRVLAAGAMGT
jgi:vacuolar-type H+-ATPase subunit C/Vma6